MIARPSVTELKRRSGRLAGRTRKASDVLRCGWARRPARTGLGSAVKQLHISECDSCKETAKLFDSDALC